jgi:hypothetical protein
VPAARLAEAHLEFKFAEIMCTDSETRRSRDLPPKLVPERNKDPACAIQARALPSLKWQHQRRADLRAWPSSRGVNLQPGATQPQGFSGLNGPASSVDRSPASSELLSGIWGSFFSRRRLFRLNPSRFHWARGQTVSDLMVRPGQNSSTRAISLSLWSGYCRGRQLNTQTLPDLDCTTDNPT